MQMFDVFRIIEKILFQWAVNLCNLREEKWIEGCNKNTTTIRKDQKKVSNIYF